METSPRIRGADPIGYSRDELPVAKAVNQEPEYFVDDDIVDTEDNFSGSDVSGFSLVLMVNDLMKNGDDRVLNEYRQGKQHNDPTLRAIYEEEKKAALFGAPFVDEATLIADEYSETVMDTESGLESNTDPFAPRKGKTLTWKNVNMRLLASGKKPERSLLEDVWGEVPRKETTAIMGPSGAGKSSLLNILSGRARSGGKLRITADVRLNNYTVDPTNIHVRKMVAFVAQDDSLQITATPREAIHFSAKLRLPRSTTDEQIEQLTTRMLGELGLVDCADTLVGGALLKGISGGERKRTSVGVELVTKPAMVFLDEPTSGLDSFSAVQVCDVLKKVANAGASVLFTIHQPSSEIFESFDHLILLNKGRVMYQGPTAGVADFFGARGHPCPRNYNPADWMMNVAQSVPIPELNKQGFFPVDQRQMGVAFEPDSHTDALGRSIHDRKPSADERPPGLYTQIVMIFRREISHILRDKSNVGARMILTIFLSTLIGFIFWGVGDTDPTNAFHLNSHFGGLMVLFIFGMLGTAQPSLMQFPDERPVFLREYSTNHYGVTAYFISRLTMEAIVTAIQTTIMMALTYTMIKYQGSYIVLYADLYVLAMASTAIAVFMGCLCGGNSKVAMQLLPVIMMPQILFAGFFVSPDLIPEALNWLQYLMPLAYSVRIAVVAEFYNCGPVPSLATSYCNALVNNIRANPDDVWWYWIGMVVIFFVARSCALVILRRSASKFY